MEIENIKIVIGVTTSIVVWFFTKRHFQNRALKMADSEVESANLDVIEKKLGFYERMLDDLDLRYLKQIENLRKEIEILEKEGKVKDEIIINLKERIKKLIGDE